MRWIRVLWLIGGTGMPPIRREAGIHRDNVTEEVDVRGVAPRLGLGAPWGPNQLCQRLARRRLTIEATLNLPGSAKAIR